MDRRKNAVLWIAARLLEGELGLDALKREAAGKFRLDEFPKNSRILEAFPKGKLTPKIAALLKRKPMRTLSGVAPVAVMVRPGGSCRWGCIYCPYTGNAPKSYTGSEPAARRARDNDFSPERQVKSRLGQFALNGHPTDKCDVIVMGGTFLAMDPKYADEFVKGIYEGLNGRKTNGLVEAKKMNEGASHRMAGLTFETRPDVCGKKEIERMLEYGGTKVELGVQNPSDGIYRKINRGHSVADVAKATALLKDAGLKVAYHIMPGLPGSSPSKDVEMFRKVFADGRFRPDMLKIYPTLVIPHTGLEKMMEAGEFTPYRTGEAAEVIAQAYKYIPEYVRVMRIQRDIPSDLISEGVKKSNLRELVEKRAQELGIQINEIRHREAGLSGLGAGKPELARMEYDASGGREIFLSMEDKKSGALSAFLRLRIPKRSWKKEIGGSAAIVRELHVFGQETPLGERGEVQHRGLGSALLSEAERIAFGEFGKQKMAVISAVGVRKYYFARGYSPEGPYVSKEIGE